jgi:predicted GTPase
MLPTRFAESSSASFVQAVSALNGKGVNDMLEAVAETFERYSKRIASRELHEWLQVRGV